MILGSIGTPPCPSPSNTRRLHPGRQRLALDRHRARRRPTGRSGSAPATAPDWSRVDPRALRTYDEQSFAGKIMHIDRNGNGAARPPVLPGRHQPHARLHQALREGPAQPVPLHAAPGRRPGHRRRRLGDLGGDRPRCRPGRNYGWPCYEGPVHTSGYKDLTGCPPSTRTRAPRRPSRLPEYTYAHSDFRTTAPRSSAGPLYPGGAYPSRLQRRHLLSATTWPASSSALDLDADGRRDQRAAVRHGLARRVDLELGPGNDLYYTNYGDGNPGTGSVKRIVYTPANRSPVARGRARRRPTARHAR